MHPIILTWFKSKHTVVFHSNLAEKFSNRHLNLINLAQLKKLWVQPVTWCHWIMIHTIFTLILFYICNYNRCTISWKPWSYLNYLLIHIFVDWVVKYLTFIHLHESWWVQKDGDDKQNKRCKICETEVLTFSGANWMWVMISFTRITI